jgi:prephenate dehydratase
MPILGKRNEYNFYVDVEWDEQKQYDASIRQILKYTHNFNILGEYERHDDEPGTTPKPQRAERSIRKYINIRRNA